jgi:predicted enzyme related to lactoylglutathione lyase
MRQSGVHYERSMAMEKNPVGWFEIYVQDITRARNFYEAVMQVKLESLNRSMPELWKFPSSMTSYGAAGALVKMDGVPSGGNSTLVYFSCADCAVEARRVPAAGGKMHKEKFSIGEYGFIALAIDTEGNMFGLHSMQ